MVDSHVLCLHCHRRAKEVFEEPILNFLDDGSLNPDRHLPAKTTPLKPSSPGQASAKQKDGPELHTNQPKKRLALPSSPPCDKPASVAKTTATQPPTASTATASSNATAAAAAATAGSASTATHKSR